RIVVFKHLRSVGSRHSCFPRRGCSHPGELHRSDRAEVPIDLKRSPLAQFRWVGKGLPDFVRRVAQLSDENQRPLLSVLSYLRPAGWTRCVLLVFDHLLLLIVLLVWRGLFHGSTSARGPAHDGAELGLGCVVQRGEEPCGFTELMRRALVEAVVRLIAKAEHHI